MTSMFKKPKAPDDSEQKQLMREQQDQLREQKAEIEARKASKRKGAMGRQSLISGAETGIPSGPKPTRTSLG